MEAPTPTDLNGATTTPIAKQREAPELRQQREAHADLNERFAERVLGHIWAVMTPGTVPEDSRQRTHRSLLPSPLPAGWVPADPSLPVDRWNQLLDYASFMGLAWAGAEVLKARHICHVRLDSVGAGGWRARVAGGPLPSGKVGECVDENPAYAVVVACLAAVEEGEGA